MSNDSSLPPDPPVYSPWPDAPRTIEQDKDSRNLAMLAHLLGIFSGFLGPLIIWLLKKDQNAYVDDQAKEALNFQITVMIAIAGITAFAIVTCGYGGLLFFAIPILQVVLGVIAAKSASAGEYFRYPLAIRLLK